MLPALLPTVALLGSSSGPGMASDTYGVQIDRSGITLLHNSRPLRRYPVAAGYTPHALVLSNKLAVVLSQGHLDVRLRLYDLPTGRLNHAAVFSGTFGGLFAKRDVLFLGYTTYGATMNTHTLILPVSRPDAAFNILGPVRAQNSRAVLLETLEPSQNPYDGSGLNYVRYDANTHRLTDLTFRLPTRQDCGAPWRLGETIEGNRVTAARQDQCGTYGVRLDWTRGADQPLRVLLLK